MDDLGVPLFLETPIWSHFLLTALTVNQCEGDLFWNDFVKNIHLWRSNFWVQKLKFLSEAHYHMLHGFHKFACHFSKWNTWHYITPQNSPPVAFHLQNTEFHHEAVGTRDHGTERIFRPMQGSTRRFFAEVFQEWKHNKQEIGSSKTGLVGGFNPSEKY